MAGTVKQEYHSQYIHYCLKDNFYRISTPTPTTHLPSHLPCQAVAATPSQCLVRLEVGAGEREQGGREEGEGEGEEREGEGQRDRRGGAGRGRGKESGGCKYGYQGSSRACKPVCACISCPLLHTTPLSPWQFGRHGLSG